MTETQMIRRPRLVWIGTGLIAASAIVAMSGAALVTTALAIGARRWMTQADLPPRRFARRHWDLAKTAMDAGTTAWRSELLAGTRNQPRRAFGDPSGNFADVAAR